MSGSVAKNTAFMTAASVGQKIVSFLYFTLVARSIGVEGTGKYFLALSFTTIFVVFVDLGLTNVLVREAAKVKEKMQSYFSTILSVKIILGILSYIVMVIAAHLLGYDLELRHLIYLSGVTMLFDSLHLTIYGVLRAIGNLKYEAVSIVGSQLITLGLGSFFLFNNYPLIFLILAFTVASLCNAVYATVMLFHTYRIRLYPSFDKAVFAHVGRIAIPFAIAAIFARLYSYADSIILSKLMDEQAVGWYSIPYKITYAFQFIPLALVAALYPRFSECFVKDKARLRFLFEQGIKYLLLIVVPIAVGIGVLAQDIIVTLYTEAYLPSVLPLQVLLAGLVFSYLSFPIGAFLNACNKQITQTVIVGSVFVVNIAANILLIPHLGVVGAAAAALVGNVVLTIAGYSIAPRITAIRHTFFVTTIVRVAVAGSLMGLCVWLVNGYTHFVVSIIAGAIAYPLLLFATRAVTVQQCREALALIRK